jgi:electron transport complex protein RnfG
MNVKAYVKFGAILAAYAAVACALLAVTYTLTKAAKEKQDAIRTEKSLKTFFPDIESFEKVKGFEATLPQEGLSIVEAYVVKQKDIVIGIAVTAAGPSYSDRAKVLVGVGLDNRIQGVKILEIKDTPGLGLKAKSNNFFIDKERTTTWFGQFTGKAADDPLEAKKDIAAITGATVTSRAISRIVKYAAANGTAYIAKLAEAAQ